MGRRISGAMTIPTGSSSRAGRPGACRKEGWIVEICRCVFGGDRPNHIPLEGGDEGNPSRVPPRLFSTGRLWTLINPGSLGRRDNGGGLMIVWTQLERLPGLAMWSNRGFRLCLIF